MILKLTPIQASMIYQATSIGLIQSSFFETPVVGIISFSNGN